MILVFGRTGQVAQALQQQADVHALSRHDVDLTDERAIRNAIAVHSPAAIINAAAYTAVDRAEEEEALAMAVNADAPTVIAQACAARGIPLVHLSTDYVFGGGGTTPWTPDAATAPLSAYGRSKCAGEVGIKAAEGCTVILRTSWVFSAQGANFVRTMLRLGTERDTLRIVNDQVGGPTAAHDIAGACLTVAAHLQRDPGAAGTYHFAGRPDVTWADFAREIFAQADIRCEVTGIPTSQYPTPAKRPYNSRLDCALTEDIFDISRPDWRHSLSLVLKELSA